MGKLRGSKVFALAVISFAFLGARVALAVESSYPVEVLGYVNNCSSAIPYATVTATCGSQTKSVKTGSTSGDLGKYSITFNNATCLRGSTTSVTSRGVTNTGVIGTYFWFRDKAYVDIQAGTNCESPSVPEFGLVTGLITLVASAGSFVFLKKKQKLS